MTFKQARTYQTAALVWFGGECWEAQRRPTALDWARGIAWLTALVAVCLGCWWVLAVFVHALVASCA